MVTLGEGDGEVEVRVMLGEGDISSPAVALLSVAGHSKSSTSWTGEKHEESGWEWDRLQYS